MVRLLAAPGQLKGVVGYAGLGLFDLQSERAGEVVTPPSRSLQLLPAGPSAPASSP